MLIKKFQQVGGSEGSLNFKIKNKILNKCWYIDFKKSEVLRVVGNWKKSWINVDKKKVSISRL